jgi:uncharacterized protein (DUF924 family)
MLGSLSPDRDPETVLSFWFGALEGGFADAGRRRDWFSADPALDASIHERFGALPDAAASAGLDDWLETPRGMLAFILVCDQFPRHLHRGRAAAFTFDALALAVARGGIDCGFDLALDLDERAFFYLPFEHSERLLDQHLAVGLFTALRDATPAAQRQLTGAWLRHAQQHRDLILRFGRFPHRNAALARESSPLELDYLGTASDFGQG